MCSLVMTLFSRDFIKTYIDQFKYQQCLIVLLLMGTVFTRAWFLDRGTSILVTSILITDILATKLENIYLNVKIK